MGIVIREDRRYFTVKFSAYRQAPGSHRYHGATSILEPQVSQSHKYHGALSTMDDLRPIAIRHLIKNYYSKLKITEPTFCDFGKSKTVLVLVTA